MNGILILAEDIISVVGGGVGVACPTLALDTMLVSQSVTSQNCWLFVALLSGGTILT